MVIFYFFAKKGNKFVSCFNFYVDIGDALSLKLENRLGGRGNAPKLQGGATQMNIKCKTKVSIGELKGRF